MTETRGMRSGCAMGILELPGIVCGEPAVIACEMVCVHEHIDLNLLCEGCLAAAHDGAIVCGHCRDAGHLVAKLPVREVPFPARPHSQEDQNRHA